MKIKTTKLLFCIIKLRISLLYVLKILIFW